MSDRRSFLRKSLLGSIGAIGFGKLSFAADGNSGILQPKERALRIAHVTDCHTQPKTKTEKALKSVFREINSMGDRPDFIINTGDSVLEANYSSVAFIEDCWNVWSDSTTCCSIPMYSCIGNHDVWLESEVDYELQSLEGKNWAKKMLGLEQTYYSFEKNGWKFIALDSLGDRKYELDDKQFEWLKNELASANGKMVCIYSHVPIMSAASMMYAMEHRSGSKLLKEMHTDVKKLKDLFYQYPNVKVCLSGHVHYIDEVDYLGVKYLCNGSVAGNWWKGSLDEFPPAYAIIDLFTDGTVQKQLIYY